MSLFIAVPVHGESVQAFKTSMDQIQIEFDRVGFDFDVHYLVGESLIQRARNTIVANFLETRFERLLFIDSDIQFKPEDVEALWNLNTDVCCGSYPFKKIGMGSTCWKDGHLVDVDSLPGPTKIDYAATGFLMIKRDVFLRMKEAYPERSHLEGLPDGNFNDRRESFSWFDPRVSKGSCTEDRIYLSEDYAFSHDWREMGGEIILNPDVKLLHWGMYGFGE